MKAFVYWCLSIAFLATVSYATPGTPSQPVDNTGINARDNSPDEVTAADQSLKERDLRVTQQIRQELMKDADLSTYGRNIKIITQDGRVTLKGPVSSYNEKTEIVAKAKAIAGGRYVSDELDVKR
jgi:osmotically-inducible protein OsmY